MVKENAVLQLGTKGQDLIMATFKKLNSQKDKFIKPAKASMGMAGGAAAAGPIKATAGDVAKEESKMAIGAKQAGHELMQFAHAASTMNPAALMQGVAGSLGRAANAVNLPGMGLVSAAAEVAGAGIAAAGNALSAVKSALPTAIDTREKQGRIAHFGGAGIGGEGKDIKYSLSEKAALIDGAVNKFGKIGTHFGTSIKRLVDSGVAPQQAAAIAQGNFQASGTDKGYFFQKIADSFGGMPPSIAQEMQAQLMDAFGTDELMKDNAKKERATAAAMDASDRSTAVQIAANGQVLKLNDAMNRLQITMVNSGAALSGMVATFGNAINKVMIELPGAIKSNKAAASDWRSYVPGLQNQVLLEQAAKAKK